MANRFFEDESLSKAYAQFRPSPPAQIVAHILEFLKEQYKGLLYLAVDVGCGTGQATVLLAPHFVKVIGADISPEQIKQGNETHFAKVKVEFIIAPAENLATIESGSCQLMTSCRATHWFDIPRFFQEAERVLCPNGVLAIFGHGTFFLRWKQNPSKDAELNKLVDDLIRISWKDYADGYLTPVVESEFRGTSIPLRDQTRRDGLILQREIRLVDFPKYFQSMSPYRRLAIAEGEEAAIKIANQFVQDVMIILGEAIAGIDKNEITLIEEQKFYLIMARK